jgi:hypothetical protein
VGQHILLGVQGAVLALVIRRKNTNISESAGAIMTQPPEVFREEHAHTLPNRQNLYCQTTSASTTPCKVIAEQT